MAAFSAGDVVLLRFPFSDTVGMKRRPALVLLDPNDDDIVVARVTGQLSSGVHDVQLEEWQQAGLLVPSVVRLDKVATLRRDIIEQRLGRLAAGDWLRVCQALRQACPTR